MENRERYEMEKRIREELSKCSRAGCGAKARVAALLSFKMAGKGYKLYLGLFLCDPCSRKVEFDKLLTEDGYKRLRAEMLAQGKELPPRSAFRVGFEPIEKGRN